MLTRLTRIIGLVSLAAAFMAGARAELALTEFLASNSNSITDEEASNEDWLELQNAGASTTSLAGYYLTDDAAQPRKWALPSWTLGSGNRLVIFASNKNRKPAQVIAGQDNPGTVAQPKLHTNFKISTSAGSYLALNKDGAGGSLIVVSSFASYPKQFSDIAYGMSTTTTTLATAGSAAKALVPTIANGGSGLGTTWRGGAEPFTDSSWQSGTLGVGVAGSGAPIGSANLKLRLNASSLAGIVSDTSGAAHDGTNTSSTTLWQASATDTTASPLMRKGVMQFQAAAGSQVTVPASTDFDSATGTMMFWMKSGGVTGSGSEGAMLWDRRNPNSVGNVIVQKANGQLFSQPAGSSSFSSTATVSDNQWHHVAFVYNRAANGTDAFYVDGVASGSVTHANAWSWPTTVQTEFGRSHDGYWFRYEGLMDDIRFYNTALTSTQIAQIATGGDENVEAADVGLSLAATLPGNAGAFIRIPFTVSNPGNFTSLRLVTRLNDGFVAYLNGTQVDALNAPASPVYTSLSTALSNPLRTRTTDIAISGGLLVSGSNILAIHGLNNSTNDANFLIQPTLSGVSFDPSGNYLTSATPGAANSGIRTSIGPIITNVTKNPSPRPTGTAASPPLTIFATVVPSLRPLATSNPVQLKYVTMYGTETSVNMTLTATANVYTAQIPTNALGGGQMLRWRVVASDNTAVTATDPEYSDPLDNEQYYGTVAVDSSIETSLPVLYWFTPNSTAADNATGTRNSFFFKAPGDTGVGRFYDNVGINIHGQSSQGFAKKSYDLDFNQDNRFEWNVPGKRVKDVNLLTNWGDKSKTHNALTHELLSTIGSVHHWCYRVRVQQVTPATAPAPASQFWSIADMMEDGDEDFIERNGRDPDGALYKVYDNLAGTGSAEKKTRKAEDKSDYQAMLNGLAVGNSLASRRAYAYDNLDLPQCVSYFVGMILSSSQDLGHKNFYMYRDTLGTREWMILPWDLDLTWGRDWLDAQGYFTDTLYTNNDLDLYNSAQQGKGENSLFSLIVGNSDVPRVPVPEFRDMVLRRLRTVMDNYFSAPNVLENRFASIANLMDPPAIGTSDADLDYTKWSTWGSNGGFTTGGAVTRYNIDQITSVYLPGRRSFLNTATLAGATVPSSQPANYADLISIQTVDFKPATGTQDHEFFVIRNSNSYAVDISGWQITGAVNWTFKPGTIIPGGGGVTEHMGDLYVAKNPYALRQRAAMPDDGLAGGGTYRLIQGPYSGQLSARGGESIELRDAAGALLKTKTWTAAPTAAQNQLRITELNYAPTAPTPAESSALAGVTTGDFEYIEFTNIGATALTLTGARFDSGVIFTFPTFTLAAGARCLVVANVAAFQVRYGHSLDAMIVGAFEGNLDSNGETLQLVDSIGENILTFTYNNAWFPPSDGGGRTLVTRSTSPAWDTYSLPQSWGLSTAVGGTPGVVDTDFATVYEGWRLEHFSNAELPTPLLPDLPAALTQDPDGDGLNNLAEYAFGRVPKTNDGTPVATPSIVTDGGSPYLAITYTRRHNALDLTYTVETTSDLANGPWTPVTAQIGSTTQLGNGVEQLTIRDSVVKGSAPRYIRVRALKP